MRLHICSWIRHHVRDRYFPADRCNVHDADTALPTHVWNRCQNHMSRCPGVSCHRALEVFDTHVLDRSDLYDSCIIDKDVDGAKMPHRALYSMFCLTVIANIAS